MTEGLQGWLQDYNLLIYEEIDSTNAEAKRLACEGVSGSYAIWAKSQLQGSGRYGRNWVSPPGNLYLSLLIRPECDLALASQIAFVTAVAMADTVAFFLPMSAQVGYKWPNDIMIDGRKTGGILLESAVKAGSTMIDWLVIGVGINVSYSPELLEERTGYQATSLHKEGAGGAHADEVLYKFMQSFSATYNSWQQHGFLPLKERCLAQALNIGKAITVSTASDRLSGVFEGINDEGCLLLMLEGGHQQVISVGEVFFGAKQKSGW